MNPEDEIKELHKRISEFHKRNVELQDSAKQVMSETRCCLCPVRFIKWLRGILCSIIKTSISKD